MLWSWTHRIGGIVAIGLAIYNVVTGSERLDNYSKNLSAANAIFFSLLGVSALIGVAGFCIGKAGINVASKAVNPGEQSPTKADSKNGTQSA